MRAREDEPANIAAALANGSTYVHVHFGSRGSFINTSSRKLFGQCVACGSVNGLVPFFGRGAVVWVVVFLCAAGLLLFGVPLEIARTANRIYAALAGVVRLASIRAKTAAARLPYTWLAAQRCWCSVVTPAPAGESG